jgi:hypothetical protein
MEISNATIDMVEAGVRFSKDGIYCPNLERLSKRKLTLSDWSKTALAEGNCLALHKELLVLKPKCEI